MSINELLSVDVHKILLQSVTSEFEEYSEKYFDDEKHADLKTSAKIKVGISKETDLVLILVEIKILDTDSKYFIELETHFLFSISNITKGSETIFEDIEEAAKPYITSEIANLVKNITSQGTNQNTIYLPYNFLE